MKKSKRSSDQGVLRLLKSKTKRKEFYKALWLNYGEEDILTNPYRHKFILIYLSDKSSSFAYIAELNKIIKALTFMGIQGFSASEVEEVHKKYWQRFIQGYWSRKSKNKPIIHLQKTKAVKEFLARGFIHRDDAIDYRGYKYTVEATIAPLVWPGVFDTHGDACEMQSKVGISGYTSAPIPK